ncbi:Pif1-like helicase domain-containing protein [Rhizophagus clarus]|uniref:ATP-dependent DNA helicase n=1 Tax=Rhizophagus clarus TaxID=94130 RepID=A0A8H3QS88_9GLOM|nr:Pif1-like helicase domain-containing protein [Rhizophagus clarus]
MDDSNVNIYSLDAYNFENDEFILDFDNSYNSQISYNNAIHQIIQQQSSPNILIPWRPFKRLNDLHKTFQQTILNQFPCLPCSNCGYLLYPDKAKWIQYSEELSYQFEIAFPRSKLPLHPYPPARIAVCFICKSNPNRIFPSYLIPIPPEIQAIPLSKPKYLSPIYLHSSMGRTPGVNPFNQYRSIVGTMNYSKNIRSFTLYSGMLGAFLESSDIINNNNHWFHPTLIQGSNWLKDNNPYLKSFNMHLENQEQNINSPFPIATHFEEENIPIIRSGEIVVPSNDFDVEIHDEDAHFSRLMAGFARTDNNLSLPISLNDPNLEALLFPDLYPDGKGTYQDLVNQGLISNVKVETYGKYIKERIGGKDPRFRLHHIWPAWSYLQLEKYRNHQNNQRIFRQNQISQLHGPSRASDLIQKSLYNNKLIVNEQITTTLPTFIRTGDSYFHEKEHHVNAMINNYGLPQLFITLTMSENKWKHLKNILLRTDNHDTLPINRPFHCTHHFIHRLRSMKNNLWKDPELTNCGKILHFFERIEFQNRGAAHIHGCLWTTKSINNMIKDNVIKADLPDSEKEPELYKLVKTHQIHTCDLRCGGPAAPGEVCKKGFSRPYSEYTYEDPNSSRFIYKCTKEQDRWIVPYHAPTLFIWNAHMNLQYVTTRGFARYMTKYIAKREPTHIFNIQEDDKYRQHIQGRRLGTMELMFLILGETICNSSVKVQYLVTDPPSTRQKSVLPISLLKVSNETPFYPDSIEKYFNRPENEEFDLLLYQEYFESYNISPSKLITSREVYRDKLGNYVIKRRTKIITRIRHLRLIDGELYFYQQLLLRLKPRSEEELKGYFSTYREHFLNKFPEVYHDECILYKKKHQEEINNFNDQFIELTHAFLENLMGLTNTQFKEIIGNQLTKMKIIPPIIPLNTMLSLPKDQYQCVDRIVRTLGPNDGKHYPYFLITGSAGIGKSFVTHILLKEFEKRGLSYLVLAPTGVAAQNIGGFTIHSALKIHATKGDEISMVSSELFDYLSNMFSKLHSNSLPFGGISVIVLGDLFQLPPVSGNYVFQSPVWKLFYPLFLREAKRQAENPQYYSLLEEARFGNITESTYNILYQKFQDSSNNLSLENVLNTTHIVSYRETAEQINTQICNTLPVENDKFLISYSKDLINGKEQDHESSEYLMKYKTNLPSVVRLQIGCRVIFLNNKYIKKQICNGTIGIVTDINKEKETVRVAFCVNRGIASIGVGLEPAYFNINGMPACRIQFPLQNAFALTVHKTQSITLPHTSLYLDNQMFAKGQAYVALSRCKSWNDVKILSLQPDVFSVDQKVKIEYARLEKISSNRLPV